MSMPEPEIDRLLAAAKDRSRQLRKRRRNLVGGSVWGVAIIAAVVSLTIGIQSSTTRTIVPTGPSTSKTSPTTPTTSTTSSTTSKTTPTTVVVPPASGPPENIVATTQMKTAMIAAFARFDGIPVSDIDASETESRPFHVAYMPSSHTYWAVATMAPATSDPLHILVTFQDGADDLVLASQSTLQWAIVARIGEPACLVFRGIPPQVESLWGLASNPECPNVSQATKPDPAAVYGVTVQIPADWSHGSSGLSFNQFGTLGFVQISSVGDRGITLESECQNQAREYGSAPSVGMGIVGGHQACFIFPSANGPSVSYAANMPAIPAAAVVVGSPISSSSGTFGYLLLRSDVFHLESIAASLQFSPGY